MSERIRYTDGLLGNLGVVADLLPRREDLAFRDEAVKVTIAPSKRRVEFFKREARGSDEDGAYSAEVPDVPGGGAADGASYTQARANGEVIIGEGIETARELGRAIPEPKGGLLHA